MGSLPPVCRRSARRLGQPAGGDPRRFLHTPDPEVRVRDRAHGLRRPHSGADRSGHGCAHRHGQICE